MHHGPACLLMLHLTAPSTNSSVTTAGTINAAPRLLSRSSYYYLSPSSFVIFPLPRQDLLSSRWFEVEDKLARDKVGQALRDGVNTAAGAKKPSSSSSSTASSIGLIGGGGVSSPSQRLASSPGQISAAEEQEQNDSLVKLPSPAAFGVFSQASKFYQHEHPAPKKMRIAATQPQQQRAGFFHDYTTDPRGLVPSTATSFLNTTDATNLPAATPGEPLGVQDDRCQQKQANNRGNISSSSSSSTERSRKRGSSSKQQHTLSSSTDTSSWAVTGLVPRRNQQQGERTVATKTTPALASSVPTESRQVGLDSEDTAGTPVATPSSRALLWSDDDLMPNPLLFPLTRTSRRKTRKRRGEEMEYVSA